MDFYPIFRAGILNNHISHYSIELRYPTAVASPTDCDPPQGFDGGFSFSEPPVYPCLIIDDEMKGPSHPHGLLHVPNRILRSEEDWADYKAEFNARSFWSPEKIATAKTVDDGEKAHARNTQKREQEKEKAIAAMTKSRKERSIIG